MKIKNITVTTIVCVYFLTGISSFPLDAECSMKSSFGISGDIFITQKNRLGPLSFKIILDGFELGNGTSKHEIQVHEGSFDNGNCRFVGLPFTTNGKSEKILSDLGNNNVENGSIRMSFVNEDLLLFGSDGIAGRTLAIHAIGEDLKESRALSNFWSNKDEKQKQPPIACCKILFTMATGDDGGARLNFNFKLNILFVVVAVVVMF